MPQRQTIFVAKWLLILIIAVEITVLAGCHRGYYRRQADVEAKCLIEQKGNDSRWNSADGSISVDPYSRMFNPFSTDHPPIPPDDATSNTLMRCVDGKRGYPHWNANGNTDFVENPEWKSYLPRNEKGEVVLDLERAYQLALLHSPEYQTQLETLYLSALDVSLERFGFDGQLFAGFNSFAQRRGRFRTGTGSPSTQIINNLGANSEGIRLQRLGTAGASYVVGLANTILFNVSGPSSRSANSLIDFSVVQPLLRNGGRDRIMEALTQSERTLLANVRQLERYRRGFYLQVATGRPPGAGPLRSGNFLNLPNGATTAVGGFYGLLIQKTQIRNQEFNVRQLQSVLEQFRELYSVGRLDAFQLRLLESNVFNQQSALVNARIRYQATLDRFMISLGLPPDLEVVIQDDSLNHFHLISDEINNRLAEVADLRRRTGQKTSAISELLPGKAEDVEGSGFKWDDELENRIKALGPFIAETLTLLQEVKADDVTLLREDLDRMNSIRDDRESYLKELQSSPDSEGIVSVLDASLYSPASIPTKEFLLEFLEGEEKEGVKSTLARLSDLEKEIKQALLRIEELPEARKELKPSELFSFIKVNIQEQIPVQLSGLNTIVLELSLLQARARANSIEIINVDIDAEQAIAIARCFRRDWMNARASLVDDWRQIEFAADQLEARFDLVLEGEMGTIGSNPLKFRDSNGQIRAGFRFDTPMIRMIERNQYRETLIRYHQSRRQFYQFEDEVKRNLRDIVRNLNRDKVLFELNRRAIQNQIEQIELSRLNLEAPQVLPVANDVNQVANARGGQLGDAAARNLADAFNFLNTIQNQFIGNWVEYEILRRSLDFDMGTMQLDELGAWVDPGPIDSTIGMRAASVFGIEPDCQFCGDAVFNPQDEITNNRALSITPLTEAKPTEALPATGSADAAVKQEPESTRRSIPEVWPQEDLPINSLPLDDND